MSQKPFRNWADLSAQETARLGYRIYMLRPWHEAGVRTGALLLQHQIRPTAKNIEAANKYIPPRHSYKKYLASGRRPVLLRPGTPTDRIQAKRTLNLESLLLANNIRRSTLPEKLTFVKDIDPNNITFGGGEPFDCSISRDFEILIRAIQLDKRVVLFARIEYVTQDNIEIYRVIVAFRQQIRRGFAGIYQLPRAPICGEYGDTLRTAVNKIESRYRQDIAATLKAA